MKDPLQSTGEEQELPVSIRLDVFLKRSRLILRRSVAQEACERGAVLVNGKTAKASRMVRTGDTVEWRYGRRVSVVRVLRVPARQPSKAEADELYQVLKSDKLPEP
ncbi:MAG: S4 domain-containing protein [Acidobacteriota bacterium]